jgi:GTP-binding protein EngB required for normal cell division
LTKIDKISAKELDKVLLDTAKIVSEHTAAHTVVLKTSSEKNLYLDELKAEVADFI